MFKRDELKALLLIASKDNSVRTYLSGIKFESKDGAVIAIATDGHRLLAIRKADVNVECDGFLSRIDAENMVKTASPNEYTIPADGKLTMGAVTATLDQSASFPNWRAATPNKFSGEVAQFDPAYVSDFGKVSKLLGNRKGLISIAYNGERPALVSCGHADAFGLLMPVLDEMPTLPDWVHEPMPQAIAA